MVSFTCCLQLKADINEGHWQMSKMNCKICQAEKATKYNHYGSEQVCHSCRVFFKRSVKSSLFKVFKHSSKNGCIINSKTRKSCKKCRFAKCLEMGMKVSFVITNPSPKRELLLDNVLTLDEESYLQHLHQLGNQASHDCIYDMLESNLNYAYLMFEQLPNAPESIEQHLDDIKKIQKLSCLTMLQVLGKENQMDDVIHVLAEHNFGRIMTFILFISFGRCYENLRKSCFVDHGKQKRKSSEECEVIIRLAEKHSQRPSHQLEKFYQYETFYASPWASQASVEEEHKNIASKVSQWYNNCKKNNEEDIDYCLNTLMLQILLFNTDGLKLAPEKSALVEKCQQKWVHLLFKYLKSHSRKDANFNHLHTAIMLVTETQRAFELSNQRLQLKMMETEDNLDLLTLD